MWIGLCQGTPARFPSRTEVRDVVRGPSYVCVPVSERTWGFNSPLAHHLDLRCSTVLSRLSRHVLEARQA